MEIFLKHFKENKEFYYFILLIVISYQFFNIERYSYQNYKGAIFRIDKFENKAEILYENYPEMIRDYLKARQDADKTVDSAITHLIEDKNSLLYGYQEEKRVKKCTN